MNKLSRIVFRTLPLMGLLLAVTVHAGNSYYLDCSAGVNGDGSIANPWNAVSMVNNHAPFVGGDTICVKRGTTCLGELWPKGSGDITNQIVLCAYGAGSAKPIIDAQGATNSAAIYLYNQEYWTIDGLEAVNNTNTYGWRWGIYINNDDNLVKHRIRILNNTVRDVYASALRNSNGGTPSYFSVGGIFIMIDETTGHADDVLIEGNSVSNIVGEGICFVGQSQTAEGVMNYDNCSPNVVVRSNIVSRTASDGMLILGTDNELVEYNVVEYAGVLGVNGETAYIVGMWPCAHVNGLWQFNEARYTTQWGGDGEGFDNDIYCQGTTMFQYNYSHNNQGGFCLDMGRGGGVLGGSPGGGGQSIFRYNISVNEDAGNLANGNAVLYNNIFYNPGHSIGLAGPTVGGNQLYNNIFVCNQLANFGAQSLSYNTSYGAFSINTDPKFVNPGTNFTGLNNLDGFKLQPNSPCFGAGLLISDNGGRDFWGDPVSATGSPDIGAFQHVPMPFISPPAGHYTNAQSVTIACAVGAAIHYTTDGNTPTISSTLYTGPIMVSSNLTINAIALTNGIQDGGMASAAYIIEYPVATPTFSPSSGRYSGAQLLTISCATPGSIIYYTTNGSVPTVSSILYSNPVTISASVPICAIATKSGWTTSAVARAGFTIGNDSAYVMKIAFAGYNSAETLTNFPALVVLSTNLPGFAYSQFASPNGYDLRFSSADDPRDLNYEIERWDTNGSSCFWVQVPALTNNSYIWACWGNTNAAYTSAAAVYTTNGATWSSSFALVEHMNETSGTTVHDSTSNRYSAATHEACSWTNGGIAGGGLNLTSSDFKNGIEMTGNNPAIGVNWTLSAWIMNFTGGGVLFEGQGDDADQHVEYSSSLLGSYVTLHFGVTANSSVSLDSSSFANHWQQLTAVGTGSNTYFYLDGTYAGQCNQQATEPVRCIGFRDRQTGYDWGWQFAYYLDEVRVENASRSSNWIWACYMNMASNAIFSSYGSVQTGGSTNTPAAGIPPGMWIQHYFPGTPTNGYASLAGSCVNSNGMTVWQDYLAGINPTNGNSCFSVIITNLAGQILVNVPSVLTNSDYSGVNRYYEIDECTNLLTGGTWQPAPGYTGLPASGGIISCTNAASGFTMFYRVKAKLQ